MATDSILGDTPDTDAPALAWCPADRGDHVMVYNDSKNETEWIMSDTFDHLEDRQ